MTDTSSAPGTSSSDPAAPVSIPKKAEEGEFARHRPWRLRPLGFRPYKMIALAPRLCSPAVQTQGKGAGGVRGVRQGLRRLLPGAAGVAGVEVPRGGARAVRLHPPIVRARTPRPPSHATPAQPALQTTPCGALCWAGGALARRTQPPTCPPVPGARSTSQLERVKRRWQQAGCPAHPDWDRLLRGL